jgi:hypothetical protein
MENFLGRKISKNDSENLDMSDGDVRGLDCISGNCFCSIHLARNYGSDDLELNENPQIMPEEPEEIENQDVEAGGQAPHMPRRSQRQHFTGIEPQIMSIHNRLVKEAEKMVRKKQPKNSLKKHIELIEFLGNLKSKICQYRNIVKYDNEQVSESNIQHVTSQKSKAYQNLIDELESLYQQICLEKNVKLDL